ncbi:hypothetical protein GGI05_006299 [Coemansia sp. RSA 2603]|nr:hypothetical protein GGI05_006299 [Coemansia sp. RSA 2603]
MISSAGTNLTDYKTIAGDFYPMQREYALVTKSSLDTSSANQFNTESSTETTDNNKNKNTDDSNVSSGTEDNLSSDDVIAVAIVVPIVTIAITVGLYFLYKWWRRHQNSVRWDPKGERENFYRMRFVDDISINDTRECNTPIEYNLIQCPPVSAHVGFLRPPLSSTLSPGNTSWSVTTTHTYWETNRATRLPAYSPSENADVYLPPEKATFH